MQLRSRRVSLSTSLSLVLAFVAVGVACSDDGVEPPVEPAGDAGTQGVDVSVPDAAPDAPEVATAPFHVFGRHVKTNDGVLLAWSGTRVRAKFEGTGISAQLSDSGSSQLDVSIDGAAPKLVVVSGGPAPYELATGLPPGEHTVEIVKRTEPAVGKTSFAGFTVTGGELVPTPVVVPARRIEMVGDSITAGYGILGPNGECSFSAETESEPMAWGALAAKELGAERSIVAWSGIGVYRDSGGGQADQMPVRYDRADGTDPASTWDHAAFRPDVVVVNLGTNDFATGDPGMAFETAYSDFLGKIRTTHPDAWIVVATSPMLTDTYPNGEQRRTKSVAAVTRVVDARKGLGDAKITLLTLDEQLAEDGYGCDYHPSATTAQKMAQKLAALLRTTLGW